MLFAPAKIDDERVMIESNNPAGFLPAGLSPNANA